MRESADLGPEASRENAADLLALVFDAGDVREGKGERSLFTRLLILLAARWPRTVVAALSLVPEFASWRTLNLIADEAAAVETFDVGFAAHMEAIQDEVARLYAVQLRADEQALKDGRVSDASAGAGAGTGAGETEDATAAGRVSTSLAGKWAPSEGSRFQRGKAKLCKRIRLQLFPVVVAPHVEVGAKAGEPDAVARLTKARNFSKMRYRRLLANLRRHLGVVESLMCGGRWDKIVPTSVPSVANLRYKKAFLVRVRVCVCLPWSRCLMAGAWPACRTCRCMASRARPCAARRRSARRVPRRSRLPLRTPLRTRRARRRSRYVQKPAC